MTYISITNMGWKYLFSNNNMTINSKGSYCSLSNFLKKKTRVVKYYRYHIITVPFKLEKLITFL